MCYWLFLDRVYVACDDFAIDEQPQLSFYIPPYAAQSDLAFGNVAVASAGSASDPAVGKLLI